MIRPIAPYQELLDTYGEYLAMQAREPADSLTGSDPE